VVRLQYKTLAVQIAVEFADGPDHSWTLSFHNRIVCFSPRQSAADICYWKCTIRMLLKIRRVPIRYRMHQPGAQKICPCPWVGELARNTICPSIRGKLFSWSSSPMTSVRRASSGQVSQTSCNCGVIRHKLTVIAG